MLLAYYSKYFIPATNEIEFILKNLFLYSSLVYYLVLRKLFAGVVGSFMAES